ncbi:MAG: class I SAM-dependent methyltransferase [Candidatus Aenigmatarchaeota archaeon]
MQSKILPYLRCPNDKGELVLRFRYGGRKKVDEEQLHCKACSSDYQISKGIPILKKPVYLTLRDNLRIISWHQRSGKAEGISAYEAEEMLVRRFESDDSELYLANQEIPKEFRRMLGKTYSPILDMCSGHGCCIQDDLKAGANEIYSTELDIMLLQAQDRILTRIGQRNKVHLLCTDVFALPFADNTFRYVTGHIGFNATSNPLRAMQEARRVMQPNAHGVTLTLIGEGDDAYLKPPRNSAEGYKSLLEQASLSVEEAISFSNNHPEAIKEKKTEFLLTKFRKV